MYVCYFEAIATFLFSTSGEKNKWCLEVRCTKAKKSDSGNAMSRADAEWFWMLLRSHEVSSVMKML